MARTYKPIKQSLDEKYGNETPSRNIANAIDRGLGNTIQHNTIADARENTPATPAFERTSKVIGEYTNPSDTTETESPVTDDTNDTNPSDTTVTESPVTEDTNEDGE